jgi:hypothetical protein
MGLTFDKIFRATYSCKNCEEENCQKLSVTALPFKCICKINESEDDCEICNGIGSFTSDTSACPHFSITSDIKRLLPLFYRYLKTDEYPDKRGIIDQNVKLIECFDIMSSLYYYYQKINQSE